MDLTHFMHGEPAELVACAHCGVVHRNEEQASHYESDPYDTALMRLLYPRYRQAFALKRQKIEPLLRPGAEVLEVGSHLGAFLEVSETWGWRPVGVDIGLDTRAFAQQQGCVVKQLSFTDYVPPVRPDAVFIWNCFEQMDNPWDVMIHVRGLVARHGLIVLQVPNADFYRQSSRRIGHRFQALGYNNLLGFPYLNGYSLATLNQMLTSTGFEMIAAFPTTLLIPPYPEVSNRLKREWRRTRLETEDYGAANAPWLEVVGRAVPLQSEI